MTAIAQYSIEIVFVTLRITICKVPDQNHLQAFVPGITLEDLISVE